MSENAVYARLEGRTVLEYPVYPIHISNRNHPLEWYTRCTFSPVPQTDEFHYARELLTVSEDGKTVLVTYKVEAMTLEMLFQKLPQSFDPEAPGLPEGQTENPPPSPQLIAAIQQKVIERVQLRLDTFAKTRGYDGIVSACTYVTSKVAKFSAEAQYCVEARDNTWSALYAYMEGINQQTTALPTSFNVIEAALPNLAWPA